MPTGASRGSNGVGGGLAALGSEVPPWLAAGIWCRCSSMSGAGAGWKHQRGGAAAELQVWVSGIGEGGMESCWYFQATNEMWRGIKSLCLSHTRQCHWSTQLLPPAPQPRTSRGSCLLTCFPWLAPMAGEVLFLPLFFLFFNMQIFIWAYFPIWLHPQVVVDGWFFLLPCGYSWIKSYRKLITVNKFWLQCQSEVMNREDNS